MNNKIKNILIDELGYSEYVADITVNELMELKGQLKTALDKWLFDRTESDVSYGGISTRYLIEHKGMTYPSALLSLNWVLIEPDIAVKELLSDIRQGGLI